MAFPPSVKLEAKRRAHFQCVICRQPFVEVHHILPQKDGGSDHIDNAAPLCGSCHDLFGDNPAKRKQLREMRDFWWDLCAKKVSEPAVTATYERLDKLLEELIGLRADQNRTADVLSEIKSTMADHYARAANAVTSANTLAEVVDAASAFATGVKVGDRTYANVVCRRCNTRIGLLVGNDSCPSCGAKIE